MSKTIKALNTIFNPFTLINRLRQTPIRQGDLLVSKHTEDFDIPRFDGDCAYRVRPEIPLTVKTPGIFGLYKDNESFSKDNFNGKEHFLIEGQNAFVNSFTGQTTSAIFLPKDVIRERLIPYTRNAA